MCACCACEDSNTTQLDFHEPQAMDEAVPASLLKQQPCVPELFKKSSTIMDGAPDQCTCSTPSKVPEKCVSYPSDAVPCPPSVAAGLTILSHLHSGQVRRSSSVLSAQKLTRSQSFTSTVDLEEQTRLITMVTAFAKEAVNGCACTLVEQGTSILIPARYSVDRELLNFTVVTKREASNEAYRRIRCPIVAIECIYTFADSNTDDFQPQILGLKPEEQERLMKLRYRNSRGVQSTLTILESSPTLVDTTSKSLQVLCMSAKGEGFHSTSTALCVSARRKQLNQNSK